MEIETGSCKISPELGEELDPPPALAHDGLNLMGDPLEDLAGLVFRRLPLQGLDFPHLVEIALVHLLPAVSGRKSPNFYRLGVSFRSSHGRISRGIEMRGANWRDGEIGLVFELG